MHREPGEFIGLWHDAAVHHAGMLLKCVFEVIGQCGIRHFNVESPASRPGSGRRVAAIRAIGLGREVDSPVALFISEVRIDFVGSEIAIPHCPGRHCRVAGGRIQVAEVGIVDGLDRAGNLFSSVLSKVSFPSIRVTVAVNVMGKMPPCSLTRSFHSSRTWLSDIFSTRLRSASSRAQSCRGGSAVAQAFGTNHRGQGAVRSSIATSFGPCV